MMKKARQRCPVCILLIAALVSLKAVACSSFLIPGSTTAFMAKNYDWHFGHGALILNQKNVQRRALVKPEFSPKTWIAKYPSLTFNQVAEHFPNGGINTEGLAVEVLVGPSEFPEESKKPAVNELQWIQYILDTSASAQEAVANAKEVDIIPLSEMKLHYHVCDQNEECIIFQYIEGKLVVKTDNDEDRETDAQVLTNSREPDDRRAKTIRKLTSELEEKENKVEAAEVMDIFRLIQKIAWAPRWQIVYELNNGRVHFRAKEERRWTPIRTASLDDFKEESRDCRLAKSKAKLQSLSYDIATVGDEDLKRRGELDAKIDKKANALLERTKKELAGSKEQLGPEAEEIFSDSITHAVELAADRLRDVPHFSLNQDIPIAEFETNSPSERLIEASKEMIKSGALSEILAKYSSSEENVSCQ